MDIHEAFDLTVKKFKLKAVDIAALSGVAATDISKFRNGHQKIQSDKLQKILMAMPETARQYFWVVLNSGEQDRDVFSLVVA
jgi:hypothetical protein